MPHLVIEHSDNTEINGGAQQLLAALHDGLASFPSVTLGDIKSRIIRHAISRLGDGTADVGIVHLRLELMTGRDVALRQQMSEAMLQILTAFFRNVHQGGQISFSVDVREMQRETYAKTLSAGVSHV